MTIINTIRPNIYENSIYPKIGPPVVFSDRPFPMPAIIMPGLSKQSKRIFPVRRKCGKDSGRRSGTRFSGSISPYHIFYLILGPVSNRFGRPFHYRAQRLPRRETVENNSNHFDRPNAMKSVSMAEARNGRKKFNDS